MTRLKKLQALRVGSEILVGDHLLEVDAELAASFTPGDRLIVLETTGEVLVIPALAQAQAAEAVTRAHDAFGAMGQVDAQQISAFYEAFGARLADDAVWSRIAEVNRGDVERARQRGRSTTRLVADDKLRENVIEGLRAFSQAPSPRGRVLERVHHDGWVAELVGAELGVVAFVFEGRPNVVADATGVLRGGNTVVFRIGSDALGTAKAILEHALQPALASASLPAGAVSLVDSTSHASAWALFSDPRLALAVARGSGAAVATLGSLAQRAGIPVSLHGRGGAWIVAADSARPEALEDAVFRSLDRKVCNTLNTLSLSRRRLAEQLPAAVRGLTRAAERRGQHFKLHTLASCVDALPRAWFETRVRIRRAEGDVEEPQAGVLDEQDLGREWEWEESPEVTLLLHDDVDQAVAAFNRHSPRFVASLSSEDAEEHERFYHRIDAPFVGDGFTRWVDGQFALNKPELGLSNWERGRLFGRGGVLSGDSVFTVRTRYRTTP